MSKENDYHGEQVAWFTEDHLTDKSATTWDSMVAERWRAKGWPVSQLYTHANPAEVERLRQFEVAYTEWIKKTEWVQQTVSPKELGMHRADVINQRFDTLRAQLAELQQAFTESQEEVVKRGKMLAEAHALLREVAPIHHELPDGLRERIEIALSASAEPGFENKGIKAHDGQKLLVQHILDNDKGLSYSSRMILEKLIEE